MADEDITVGGCPDEVLNDARRLSTSADALGELVRRVGPEGYVPVRETNPFEEALEVDSEETAKTFRTSQATLDALGVANRRTAHDMIHVEDQTLCTIKGLTSELEEITGPLERTMRTLEGHGWWGAGLLAGALDRAVSRVRENA